MRLHAQFNEVREPRRWLYRTVHNLALNHRRQAGKIVSLNLPGRPKARRRPTTPPTRSRCRTSKSPAGKASAWCGSAWKPSTTAAAN